MVDEQDQIKIATSETGSLKTRQLFYKVVTVFSIQLQTLQHKMVKWQTNIAPVNNSIICPIISTNLQNATKNPDGKLAAYCVSPSEIVEQPNLEVSEFISYPTIY